MILVVGGAGYIGSHVNRQLSANDFKTIIFDNLGRGHRDFVKWGVFFEGDLADAHIRALKHLKSTGKSDSFNLGNDTGHSVRDIISMVRKLSQRDFTIVESDRREGDPPVLISSSRKASDIIGWKPQFADIETIVGTAWNWHKKDLKTLSP